MIVKTTSKYLYYFYLSHSITHLFTDSRIQRAHRLRSLRGASENQPNVAKCSRSCRLSSPPSYTHHPSHVRKCHTIRAYANCTGKYPGNFPLTRHRSIVSIAYLNTPFVRVSYKCGAHAFRNQAGC